MNNRNLVAEYHLKDYCNNKYILLVYSDSAGIHYSLFGATSEIPYSISNIGLKTPLPYIPSSDVVSRIDAALATGSYTVMKRTVPDDAARRHIAAYVAAYFDEVLDAFITNTGRVSSDKQRAMREALISEIKKLDPEVKV
jgi:hypothetical protein